MKCAIIDRQAEILTLLCLTPSHEVIIVPMRFYAELARSPRSRRQSSNGRCPVSRWINSATLIAKSWLDEQEIAEELKANRESEGQLSATLIAKSWPSDSRLAFSSSAISCSSSRLRK